MKNPLRTVHQNKNKSPPSWCFFSSPCSPTLRNAPRMGRCWPWGRAAAGTRLPLPMWGQAARF